MVYTFIMVILFALLPDLYIWSNFVKGGSLLWSILYWLPTTVLVAMPLLALMGKWQNGLFQLFIYLFLLILVPKCLFVLCSLAGKGLAAFLPAASGLGNGIGIAAALVVMAAAGYGMSKGWKRLVVKETDIVSEEIPRSFDGYTIVQLSDFHIGTYGRSPETVREIVDRVNALHPDAIFFTGDLVNSSPDELPMFIPALQEMKAKDGVFSILGNHDYCEYRSYTAPDSPARSLARLIRTERDMGWTLLLNEHRLLRRGNDSIAVIGVENDGEPPFPSRADLRKATGGLDGTVYKILLSHDPSHWRRSVLPDTDIQLTLSGHTHAMQLKFGSFSPAKWHYPEWGGLYRDHSRLLHVSTGVGSNVAFRFGVWPEINVIRLHSKQN